MNHNENETATAEKTDLEKSYNIIFHNDNFTTMDFVMDLLQTVFEYSEGDSYDKTMEVHNNGKAVVGTYQKKEAISKHSTACKMAYKSGFAHFTITVEQA